MAWGEVRTGRRGGDGGVGVTGGAREEAEDGVGGVCRGVERGESVSMEACVRAQVVVVMLCVCVGVVCVCVGGVEAVRSLHPWPLSRCPCDTCASCAEAFDKGEVACRHSSDVGDAVGGGGQEDGREWRRGRRVEERVGAWWWERTAKGLAV